MPLPVRMSHRLRHQRLLTACLTTSAAAGLYGASMELSLKWKLWMLFSRPI